ncbi:sigma-E processing peptidase SpoIIGA [Clostridium sp.]|uniref:sigma-E processing peptidase SpoIIGA n=1 Tax=Clostridium sp. TaxID=1506 RepID=UPI00260A9590|nr:sigma-E processing peptidase SpoIIGA [Clostridium sp.]
MVVYIDIIIIENFIINLFLLINTMKSLKFNYNKKIYLSSAIGAFYTITLFMKIRFLTSIFMKIFMVAIMILICHQKRNIKNILKATTVFFLLSFMLCGFGFSLYFMDNQYDFLNQFTIKGFSLKYILISIMILNIVFTRIIEFLKERFFINNFIYDMEIIINGSIINLKGFLDTGNALREPITNLPCILIEEEYLQGFNLKNKEKFYINYKTIGNCGDIEGFIFENIRIKKDKESWSEIKAVICKSEIKLSKENEFNALLSRGVI